MKKNEFKKILKKENHPIIKETLYCNIFNTIFIILMICLLVLQYKEMLPSINALICIVILLIPAIPFWVFDMKREKLLKEMFKKYKEEEKIIEAKDNTKIFKILLIIEIIFTIFTSGYIVNRVIYNVTVKTKEGEVLKTIKHSFDNKNFSLKIPEGFKEMSDELINIKYPNNNPPTFVFTNDTTTINVTINITNTKIKNAEIKTYIRLLEEELSSIASVKDTDYYELDNHNIGEIKFISKAVDTNIYNHMLAFSQNGMLRIISFNCTEDLQANWEGVGNFIINSLKF